MVAEAMVVAPAAMAEEEDTKAEEATVEEEVDTVAEATAEAANRAATTSSLVVEAMAEVSAFAQC